MLKTTTIPESRLASLKSTVFGWEANKWLALVSYLTKSSTHRLPKSPVWRACVQHSRGVQLFHTCLIVVLWLTGYFWSLQPSPVDQMLNLVLVPWTSLMIYLGTVVLQFMSCA